MEKLVSGNTHIGSVRKKNEDAYGICPDLDLYVVADGLGGHAGGEVASRIAVETITKEMAGTDHETFDEIRYNLLKVIKEANTRIISESVNEHNLQGMGTTVVVLIIEDDKAVVAHVGDSRSYLIRGDVITQITKDHTVVEEYIRLGLLTPRDAACHPSRHILSRALGIAGNVDIDMTDFQLVAGDTIILCTDGLTNMLQDKKILEIVNDFRPSADKITDNLIKVANQSGGIDNITIITTCVINDAPYNKLED